jgi:predicted nucleic acid-binding protein
MFVLDTNAISELRAGKPMPSDSVRHWAGEVPANQLYLAAVTVLELEIGVLAMERKDSRQGRILRSWLQGVIKEFSSQVLPFTGSTDLLADQNRGRPPLAALFRCCSSNPRRRPRLHAMAVLPNGRNDDWLRPRRHLPDPVRRSPRRCCTI